MSSDNPHKLNFLLKCWPSGIVMVASALNKEGVYQQLANRYVKSGWLESIGRGAFIKAGDQVDWTGALFALQRQLNLSVHVGAKTALELSGHFHFAQLGSGGVLYLFGKGNEMLPNWFLSEKLWNQWSRKVCYVAPKLFQDEKLSSKINGLLEKDYGSYKIIVSSPERAVLEMLYLVPSQQTLEEAKYLMEGLMTLRPKVLQSLLECCTSIKTKRIFLFLADFCHLPCLEHLDLSSIDLGKGKRVIGAGGCYISKYQIAIPQNFKNTFQEEF